MYDNMSVFVFCTFLLGVFTVTSAVYYDDTFKEELLIKPLPTGQVYTQFRFVTKKKLEFPLTNSFKHFRLFPRSFGEIVSKHTVQELHLSLTQGLWRHEKWGYPYRDTSPGLELWAWFQKSTVDVTSTWKNLVNVLSGQFCASLNFIDETKTAIPRLSLRPEGAVAADKSYNSSYLRYATLPQEVVCTENLTPFKKLLPCDTTAGLSTLLNAVHMFSTHFVSLAIDFKTVCQDAACSSLALHLEQSVSTVFDSPQQQRGKQDWSFVKLFGSTLLNTCPVASESLVYVDISRNKTGIPFTLIPQPSDILENEDDDGKEIAVYDLKKMFSNPPRPINVAASYKTVHIYGMVPEPTVYANKYIEGYGQERGGIHCNLYNRHAEKPLKVIYLDVIPWFLRLYSHTLLIQNKGEIIETEYIHYEPARDRERPHHLEIMFTLPPRSEVDISIEFDYAFLKWTEYPPDANHGFYVGPAVISTLLDANRNFTFFPSAQPERNEKKSYFLRLHTQILVVTLPTPDFSMPYNVICLACTVVALAFGPIHNITTKSLQPAVAEDDEGWLTKMKKKYNKWKSKRAANDNEQISQSEEQIDRKAKKEQ